MVTSPGSANPIAGQAAAIKTFGRCIDSMVVKEPVAMKMALGENPKSVYHDKSQAPVTRMATAALIREQLYKARHYAQELARAQQEDEALPEYDLKCEALLPVLDGRLPVHIHAHRADDIFTALRIAREFSLNCVIVHGTEAHLVADLIAEENVPVVCGPYMTDRSKPELVGQTLDNPALLHRAGLDRTIL